MINLQTFLLGLLVVSTITGLATQAVKKVMDECRTKYYSNTIAGIISIVLSIGVSIGYIFLNNLDVTSSIIIYTIALAFMSWLCAMIGYDKVIQAISQISSYRKDDSNE